MGHLDLPLPAELGLRQAHVHLDRQGVVRQVLFTDELPNFDNARD